MYVVLVVEIAFKDADQKSIKIPKGTEIYIDPTKNVGLWRGFHFHIDSHEYACFN